MKEYTLEIFPFGEGYGYKIFDTDFNNYIVYQEYDPDKPGYELMSADDALSKGQAVLDRVKFDHSQTADGVVYVEVPTKAVVPWIIGPVEFFTRFEKKYRDALLQLEEQTEQNYEQAVAAGNVPQQLADLKEFFVLYRTATEINLKYEPTIQGITTVGTIIGMSLDEISEVLAV